MANDYLSLCELTSISPVTKAPPLSEFSTVKQMAATTKEERLTAAMHVFLDFVMSNAPHIDRLDVHAVDEMIVKIDKILSEQLDLIFHHPQFQHCESLWDCLFNVVHRSEISNNTKIEILDVNKETLAYDFSDASDIKESGLYQHVYVQEYDTPGGEPFTAIISNYEFDAGHADIALLKSVSKVAASAHCPFIASVGPAFFQKKTMEAVVGIKDLNSYLDRADYLQWNEFRQSEEARYVGLTLPRYILRLPYGDDNPTRGFEYRENALDPDLSKYLWGSSTFLMAGNIIRSFARNGWAVNIRGPESGGKITDLPIHQFDIGCGLQTTIPTEVIISETQELVLAKLGFIPISYYKNTDFACFFSANSVQQSRQYQSDEATINSKVNARLPYIFLCSRLAHYLKVLQRENIGVTKNPLELQTELNHWLQTLVTKMNKPGPDLISCHPLRFAEVAVEESANNPGFYQVSMTIMPHFQIEGVDVKLSMVGHLPQNINSN